MSDKKVNQISDEQLIKCMKDYLDNPARYHPEYLQLLMKDYERRINERIAHAKGEGNNLPTFENPPPAPERNQSNFERIDTSGL